MIRLRKSDVLDQLWMLFGCSVLVGYLIEQMVERREQKRTAAERQWQNAEAMRGFYAAHRDHLIAEEMMTDVHPAIDQ